MVQPALWRMCVTSNEGAECICPLGKRYGCMRLTKIKKEIALPPTNVQGVKNAAEKKLKDTPYYHLLLLFAEVTDNIAHEHNCYSTIGGTKKADALTLSTTLDGDRQTLYDSTLLGLAEQAAEVHDPL